MVGGATAAGMVGGLVLGRRVLRPRAKLLGIPLPRRRGKHPVAGELRRAGKQLGRMADEVGRVRHQAHLVGKALSTDGGRQSPIEVLLNGLTSRRPSRHE